MSGLTLLKFAILMITSAFTFEVLAVGDNLQKDLQGIAAKSDGRIGICALGSKSSKPVCVNGDQHFPLQSVMKLIVAATVMDAVDRQSMKLTDVVTLRPGDASPGPQEFANLVRAKGSLRVTVEELMKRAVVDSDSTSVDMLIERLGGVAAVQTFLQRKHVEGISIDRNERDVQAESVGLVWKPEFADPEKFDAAAKMLPDAKRGAAWDFYLKDQRDTATPAGMVMFLKSLAAGELLSESSTHKLMAVIAMTATGRDRLKAGTPTGWSLGHKTGTGRTWKGTTSATNDVGILTAPDGGRVAIAVFVTASKRSNDERASIIAKAAMLTTSAYQAKEFF